VEERPVVLVVGATGTHGRTGTTVVDRLIADGCGVRVLARSNDERAAVPRTRGASTVIGDLHDRSTTVPAVDGVAAVYFTHPIDAGVISAAANFASALGESGQRPHVVVMSMAASPHASRGRLGQARVVAEELLMSAGLNPTILSVGALFHENVLLLHAQSICDHGVISNSFGSARVPWIAATDAGELAVQQLLEPAPSSPVVTYPPGGGLLGHGEIAKIISAETRRSVEYPPLAYQQWRETIEAQARSGQPSALKPAMAQHISALGGGFASGKAPAVPANPQMLATTLGRAPTTFTEFVQAPRRIRRRSRVAAIERDRHRRRWPHRRCRAAARGFARCTPSGRTAAGSGPVPSPYCWATTWFSSLLVGADPNQRSSAPRNPSTSPTSSATQAM